MPVGWVRGVIATALVVVGLVWPSGPATAQPDSGDDGLVIDGVSTYVVDLPAEVVHVRIELTFENTIADEPDGDGVRSTFFTGYAFGIHGDAEAVATTTADGAVVEVAVDPVDANVQVLELQFPDELHHGERLTLVTTYDLPGFAPRSPSWERVNRAYAAFSAFAAGDPGRARVQIIAPENLELTARDQRVAGGRTSSVPFGDQRVLTYADIAAPDDFSVFATATDDAQLTATELTVAGPAVTLRSWPDDPEWSAFMGAQLTDGLPALATLIGQPIDDRDELTVLQSMEPAFDGYAGWFDSTTGRIEIGESLDAVTALHEAGHAWFDEMSATERWIVEGLAETYANAAVDAIGGEPVAPKAPTEHLLALNDWRAFGVGDDIAAESYGYQTSYYVVDAMYDEIGAAAMRDVLDHAFAGTSAYDIERDNAMRIIPDWREFLDLLELTGGSRRADDLFRRYVLKPTEAAVLDERRAALDDLAEISTTLDGWTLPGVVHDELDGWHFPIAVEAMDAAGRVLDQRAEVEGDAVAASVDVPDLGDEFAAATDGHEIDAVGRRLAELGRAIDAVTAADARATAPLQQYELLGLRDVDLPALLADARAAIAADDADRAVEIADAVVTIRDEAAELGRRRMADWRGAVPPDRQPLIIGIGVASALAAAALAVVLTTRRRVRSGLAGRRSPELWNRPGGRAPIRRVGGEHGGASDPAWPVGAARELRGVRADVDASGDPPGDREVGVGVGDGVDLDEDALAGAVLSGIDRPLQDAGRDDGEGP